MLKKFGMEDCKLISNPMVTGCKLRKNDESKEVDQRLYRLMIGNLLYVTTSIPDVMQATGQVARFQATLKETHVLETKRSFRYLKGTTEFGLWYQKITELTMFSYTYVDWEGRSDDKRSTSGVAFYLGECLVSWLSKKKPLVSLSTK
jgi:hypothetical protein